MTDIVPIKAPLPASGGDPIAIVPRDFEQVWRMATVLSRTSMVPKEFKEKPEEIAAAIMYGLEIGLSPVTAVQSIAVINGRPSLFGDVLPALMRKHGHRLEERVEGAGDAMTATVTLVRKDGERITRKFSMADARRAGLAGKSGPWQQYPQRMIQLRARSWAVRDGAAEVLRGLAVREEMEDVAPLRDVTPDARSTRPTPVEAPPLDDVPTSAAVDPPAPEVVGEETPDPPYSAKEAIAFVAKVKEAVADSEISYQPLSEIREIFKPNVSRLPEDMRAEICTLLDIDPETL